MLNTYREIRDAARMLESYVAEGREEDFYWDMHDVIAEGGVQLNRISARDLFEQFVPGGDEVIRASRRSRGVAMRGVLLEGPDAAVRTTAFANITGQLLYRQTLQALEQPNFIANQLMTTVPSDTGYPEIIPGVTPIGDQAEEINEADDYPTIGIGEDWITTPAKPKRGFMINITEETVFEDRLGEVLRVAATGGTWMGINFEKEVLDTVLGITNTYQRRKGAVQNTYGNTHTEGDFDNIAAANPLTNYASIDTMFTLFDGIDDPNTGEPILMSGNMQLVVPRNVRTTALAIIGGSVKLGADSANVQTIVTNPLNNTDTEISVVSNQWVSKRGGSTSWWIGDFPGAFEYRENWPLGVFQQGRNSDAGFDRDVIARFKVRRKGAMSVVEPRKVARADNS